MPIQIYQSVSSPVPSIEPMFGLIPVRGRNNQFPCRTPARHRKQQPMQRRPRHNAKLFWHAAVGQLTPGEKYRRKTTAKTHARHSALSGQGPEPRNKESRHFQKIPNCKDRVRQRPNPIAADDKQKRDEAAWPKFTEKPARLPHMHEKCLHPAFVS